MLKVTKANLNRVFKESLICPNRKGIHRILLDVKNTDYYLTKATELIREAKIFKESKDAFEKRLQKAILCIGLARLNEWREDK